MRIVSQCYLYLGAALTVQQQIERGFNRRRGTAAGGASAP